MERGLGFGRAVLYGALVAVLLIAGGGLYAWRAGLFEHTSVGPDVVLVSLVLPDDQGVALPRTIEVVRSTDGDISVQVLDPLESADVPGTTRNELREAYPFGGGAGLAKAVRARGGTLPAYVIVTPAAWKQISSAGGIEIDVPEHMEVFDGAQVYTFREGQGSYSGDEIVAMLKGADYASAGARENIREQLGAYVLQRLAEDPALRDIVDTDLSGDDYIVWSGRLASTS